MPSTLSVPVVDLSQHLTSTSLAAAIQDALQTVGFLVLRSHGLNQKRMFELSKAFFEGESQEEKEKVKFKKNRGWSPVAQETLDPLKVDQKEGFNVGPIFPWSPPTTPQKLPPSLASAVDEIAEFQHGCFELCQRLLRAFALIVELPEDFFISRHREGSDSNSIIRLLHYPPLPSRAAADLTPTRAGAHTDNGSITLLFRNATDSPLSREGLELLPPHLPLNAPASDWIPVPCPAETVCVNIGDAMEFWSGGRLKSTLHRVAVQPSTNSEKGRYSIAYFNHATPGTLLKNEVPYATELTEVDLERMKMKGVYPGMEIEVYEYLQRRLGQAYNLEKEDAA